MRSSIVGLGVLLVIVLGACGEEPPRAAEPSAVAGAPSPKPRPADKPALEPVTAGVVAPSAGGMVDATVRDEAEVVAANDAEAVVPDRDIPAATALEADAKLAGSIGTGAPGERGTPSIVTPLPELCREACANAHRLVLAELPADTAKAMREEVQRALERECPGRCMQRASLESARCIATAKSALELATCQ